MNVAPRPLDIISLCTGGGGLDLGVGLALPGARSVCLVEREAFAVAHLVSAMEQGLFHAAPVWSDARTFDGRAWRGCVDGVIGGIPCQPHSLAGKKRGSLDARDLWSDARRIVVQSRAWFVLIENVGGMLAAGADQIAGAQRVWRDLLKLGFQVEGGLFTAAEVGAPHERERIFILGMHDGLADASEWGRQPGSGHGAARYRQSELEPADQDFAMAAAFGSGREGGEWAGTPEERHGAAASRSASELCPIPLVDPTLVGRREGRAEPGFRCGRDAAAGAGDAVADAGGDGRGAGHQRQMGAGREGGAAFAAASGGQVGNASIARGGPIHAGQRRFVETETVPDRTGLFPPSPADLDAWRAVIARSPELEPAFCRVADGLASRLDAGRVDRLRMLGNGVVPLVAGYAVRTLLARHAASDSTAAARLVRMMEAR